MKIISLTAENIKKLVAVKIVPDSHVVEITGRNASGKSSVLDSIWWALAGAKSHQSRPIRRGQTKALIRLDLGDIIVTRKFRENKKGRVTTSLIVETTEGARFPSPQAMLDKLMETLAFDPLEFSRMDASRQYDHSEAALRTRLRGPGGEDHEGLLPADDGEPDGEGCPGSGQLH